jgi:hypothetical protein
MALHSVPPPVVVPLPLVDVPEPLVGPEVGPLFEAPEPALEPVGAPPPPMIFSPLSVEHPII